MILKNSRRRRSGQGKTWTTINCALLVLFTLLSILTVYLMFKYHFLAFRNINIFYTAIIAVIFLLSLVLIISQKAKVLTTILLVIFSIITGATAYGFKSAVDLTANLNKTTTYSEVKMSIVVPKDSDVNSVSDLTSVQAPLDSDKTNINALLEQIKSDKNVDLSTEKVDSYQTAYKNLMDGTSKAMVLSGVYSSLLELNDSNYASNLKTIYSYTVSKQVSSKTDKKTSSDSFNIFISGIDTYGSISTVSRSDVNIIMTVNMKTHKILLTTTPRDAYVTIPDGGNNQKDKLTHAGIYGVETSMKTLENLYGIDIDYYARINFTSFIKLIDLLGGVEVYNDQEFTSLHGNYKFPVGKVSLDSEKALGFVRERYSLEGGDNDRGKNQEKVISAIINKLGSMNSIAKFSNIVTNLQSSVQTNMSLDSIMNIANAQLASGDRFTVTSQSVTGTGSTGELTSYAMPNASLYMMSLDQSSVDSAKSAIEKTLEGN